MLTTPSMLFVCVKNGGKSQMAAGLLRKVVGDTVMVGQGAAMLLSRA